MQRTRLCCRFVGVIKLALINVKAVVAGNASLSVYAYPLVILLDISARDFSIL